jgi:hypothetical protein
MHFEIFLLQVTEKLLISCHVEEAPLSKYHTDPNALDAMHAIKEKSSSNYEVRASPAVAPTTFLFFFFYRQLVARCPCS